MLAVLDLEDYERSDRLVLRELMEIIQEEQLSIWMISEIMNIHPEIVGQILPMKLNMAKVYEPKTNKINNEILMVILALEGMHIFFEF